MLILAMATNKMAMGDPGEVALSETHNFPSAQNQPPLVVVRPPQLSRRADAGAVNARQLAPHVLPHPRAIRRRALDDIGELRRLARIHLPDRADLLPGQQADEAPRRPIPLLGAGAAARRPVCGCPRPIAIDTGRRKERH